MKLLPLLVVPLAGARVVHNQHQVPVLGAEQDEVVPQVAPQEDVIADDAPAVGVQFTTSYALAAARYENGTTRELVKVNGDAEYIELMRRWMDRREIWEDDCERMIRRPSMQYETARWKCNWRKVSRSVRGVLGLPVSRDVAVLSNFLKLLQSSVEVAMGGQHVTDIMPAMFPISQSKEHDFMDALDFVGMTSTRIRQDGLVAYHDVNAAYAGLGHGLCQDMSDRNKCSGEESGMTFKDVLFLNFDNSSFTATLHYLHNAYVEWGMYGYGFNMDLGWWNLPIHEVPRAKFWADIHELIVDAVSNMPRQPQRVVLMGEHGGDKEFREVAEAALWSALEIDADLMLKANKVEDVAGLVARGAAELGWRARLQIRQDELLRQAMEEYVMDL